MKDLLIIQSDLMLKQSALDNYHKIFTEQLKTGIIIIPAHFKGELVNVPDNIEVIVEVRNKMKFNKKLTITLTKQDVKEIVADYIVSQGFKATPEDVELIVGTEYRGYGMGEYQTAVFKECGVTVKGEK